MVLDYSGIGLRLKKAREKLNLSIPQAAQKMHICIQSIHNIENAKSILDVKQLCLFSSAYNISIEEILGCNISNNRKKSKKRFEINFEIKTEKNLKFKITRE